MNDLSVLRIRYNQKSINITNENQYTFTVYIMWWKIEYVSHKASCTILEKKMERIQRV